MLRQQDVSGPMKRLKADFDLIDGGFTDYHLDRHFAAFTIALY
jgi:hypothetical protein